MAAASSSSNPVRKKLYDVFISFRGEDTRNIFTCHLYDAFDRKKINAYLDEESLDKGDEISPALMKAIQESKISVVILSKNYASSSWCLEELRHILQCKEIDEQIVVPIFYHVDPSHVRKQQESYAATFTALEQCFHDEIDKVQQWRKALTAVSNLSGWESSVKRSDSKLVEAIVKDIVGKLNRLSPWDNHKGLVGIDGQIEKIESLLNIGSQEVRIVGIWGIGGIGKTTLAHVLFNRFASQFEGCFFLENTKEEITRSGLSSLKKALFSGLLGEESSVIVNEFQKNRLLNTKCLVVLDDVDNSEQLEYLIGEGDLFGPGSKIVITTRDAQVLENIAAHGRYKVESLDFEEALQLFCLKAFRGSSPPEDYALLSRKVVEYCQGLPLALKVLGGHLCSKSTKVWESALGKLKEGLNPQIHNVLRISYDGLEPNEKEIFLDIACFLKGRDREFVERILHACDLHVPIGIQILSDKALITLEGNRFYMHDLLQEMGHQIVREESIKDPGKRSRLWLAKDICCVLRYNTGTGVVQAMSLNFCELGNDIDLDPQVFKGIFNLKFLLFRNQYYQDCTKKLNLPQGLQYLPDELRYLCWENYPLRSLPQSFIPEKLVELLLEDSKLEKLWDGVQNLGGLKILNLQRSKNLTEIPDLSLALNLEDINLRFCRSLEHLPTSIGKLESLQSLYLSRCSKFHKFPELPSNIRLLDMEGTAIEQVPPSIECLSQVVKLLLYSCKKLKSLPTSICKLKSLETLGLMHCSRLEYFPEILEPMPNLSALSLEDSGIKRLPASIANLVGIKVLGVRNCKKLEFIPDTVYNLALLWLDLSYCWKLENLPGPLSNGMPLESLDLSDTNVSQIPDNLFSYLTLLWCVNLSRTNIRRIPESIKFSKLYGLHIRECKFLQSRPELPLTIREVDARGCTSPEMVSNSMAALTQPPKDHVCLPVRFEFSHCIKLKHQNIMPEFQIRALLIATKFALQGDSTQNDEFGKIEMWYPGEEIPKWFNYQTEGCSMNVRLPHNPKSFFMCFAFCFIVKHAEYKEIESLECEINAKTIYGNERQFRCKMGWEMFSIGNPKSLHVFMTTFMSKEHSFSFAKEISFNIRGRKKAEIRRFGVRILYVEDVMRGIINGQYLLQRSNDVTNKGKQSRFQMSMLELLHYLKVSPSRKELCEKIWSSNLDDRYKILWWKLVRDVLPVRAVLSDVGDTRCPLCGLGLETATHLFLFCDSVRPLWFMSVWGLRTDSLLCDSMASFLDIVLHGHPNSNAYQYDEEFLVYASVLVDTIWCARNELVYQGKEFHILDICSFVHAQFKKIISSLRHSRKRNERPWTEIELLFEAQKEVSAKRLQTDASVLEDDNQPMIELIILDYASSSCKL